MVTKFLECDFDSPETQKFCGDCGTQLNPSESIPAITKAIEMPAQELTRDPVLTIRYEIIEELAEVAP